MTRQRAARIAAAIFVVTAALFVIGVNSETDDHHEADETTATHDETADEGAESEESEEGETHDEATVADEHDEGAAGEETHDEESEEETILGIDVESPEAIAVAVIASTLLAGALYFRPVRAVLGIGVAFAVLDIAEIAHQADESNTGLAVLAGAIAAGHLAAAAASGLALRAHDDT